MVHQIHLTGTSWQGAFSDFANIVHQIKRTRAFGRLSLRNAERFSIAQLYFRAGKCVHAAGNKGDVHAILADLQEWTDGFLRFERGITTADVTLNDEHEQLLIETLSLLQQLGIVTTPMLPRVIEGDATSSPDAKQLITPLEWGVLIEATRRVSLAAAQLVGPAEAMGVLKDILDDCAAAFPAFSSLKIVPSGYLHIVDRSQFDSMARENVLEGFTALIATCQYFLAPIIGDKAAHKLIIQALQDVEPALENMGVFKVDTYLLTDGGTTKA